MVCIHQQAHSLTVTRRICTWRKWLVYSFFSQTIYAILKLCNLCYSSILHVVINDQKHLPKMTTSSIMTTPKRFLTISSSIRISGCSSSLHNTWSFIQDTILSPRNCNKEKSGLLGSNLLNKQFINTIEDNFLSLYILPLLFVCSIIVGNTIENKHSLRAC